VRPTRIDQVVPSFAGRDAIGIHILHVRDLLRDMGFASDIYCGGALPEVRDQAFLIGEIGNRPSTGRWLLFHHSSGSPVAEAFLERPEPKIVDYHNITPAPLVGTWAPWVHEELAIGREQLARLAQACFYALADSAYNEEELREKGCAVTGVVAPLFDLASFEQEVDEDVLAGLLDARAGGGSDWLFVGRVAPHKAQHDVIKAFACYRRGYDPKARLRLVGTWMGDDYPRALRRFADRLGLGEAVEITGLVSAGALAAYYRAADVFVCASDHEGFCVPLVEAMHLGVPVVAFGSTAIPETVGAGGVVVEDKSPLALAIAAHRVVTDPVLRERLVAAGHRRAQRFSLEAGRSRMRAAINDILVFAEREGVGEQPTGTSPGARLLDRAPGGTPSSLPTGA
jgi:glycosyltransferase involved in cell wall biosynthesis